VFLDLLLLVARGCRHHHRCHHASGAGGGRALVESAVSHRHHALADVALRSYQYYVELESNYAIIKMFPGGCFCRLKFERVPEEKRFFWGRVYILKRFPKGVYSPIS
jgi:hypothetical protein